MSISVVFVGIVGFGSKKCRLSSFFVGIVSLNQSQSGAVEEKVASNIGVQGSNPGRDCPVCENFRMAKTDDSYVKIPTKTDQNDEQGL